MKILILVVGPTDDAYTKEACDIYFKRLKHYIKVDYKAIPNLKKINTLSNEERKSKEGELILKEMQPGDQVVLLDENGVEMSSRGFSKFFVKKMNAGTKRLVFVVGGAFGFSEEVYQKASSKISLSQMTFSHQMIRVFLLEQIYRAFTIIRNEPYHND